MKTSKILLLFVHDAVGFLLLRNNILYMTKVLIKLRAVMSRSDDCFLYNGTCESIVRQSLLVGIYNLKMRQ